MCVCLQSVVTGTMTGERACRCECVLGDYYSLRDLGVDHQFVLVASCTLVVPNPNSSIQIMELMVGKTDTQQLTTDDSDDSSVPDQNLDDIDMSSDGSTVGPEIFAEQVQRSGKKKFVPRRK